MFVYRWRDDQAEQALVAGLNTKNVYLRKVTHFSTNRGRRWATSLMHGTTLPLSQAARTWLF